MRCSSRHGTWRSTRISWRRGRKYLHGGDGIPANRPHQHVGGTKGVAHERRSGLCREVGDDLRALTDPDSGEVRYIGQTVNAPLRRHRQHMAVARMAKCASVGLWIRSLQHDGKAPGLTILEAPVELGESARREVYWIRYYEDHGADLLNTFTITVSRDRWGHGRPSADHFRKYGPRGKGRRPRS
jgi:hypothetical protein